MTRSIKSFSALVLLCLCLSCAEKQAPPNIILIMTDDQGYGDISAHGSPDVSTPHMDALKTQSISLEDFQVSPTCAPTRAAILSGMHPFKTGVTHTILERERMALGITTLPEILKRGGYTSGIFGKWHLGDEDEYQPENRGFKEVFIHGAGGIGQAYAGSCADVPDNTYMNPVIKHNGTFVKTEGFCTDVFFTQALSWIRDQANQDQPFFAYIATNAPHSPYIAPESYKEKFKKQDYTEEAQGYYGMIENIDDNLGLLMKKVEEWELVDNTILIFMSDNGKALRDRHETNGTTYNAGMKGLKGSVHEGGTRVPFFIRWPNHFTPGEKVDALLNHYDILPTLAEITGINISDLTNLDGQSFLSYLENTNAEAEEPYRFFHKGRWPLNPKNANNQEGSDRWIGKDGNWSPDSSRLKNYAVRNERYRFVNNDELYDVIKDQGQQTNIASEYPEVVQEMRTAYQAWWDTVRPLMVNEMVPLAEEKPFWVEYEKQQEEGEIKQWKRPSLD